eukprot:scaffold205067_cov45-Prasinocladus_malaysianus.AAC.1
MGQRGERGRGNDDANSINIKTDCRMGIDPLMQQLSANASFTIRYDAFYDESTPAQYHAVFSRHAMDNNLCNNV